MNDSAGSNPCATRFTRPGAITFIFPTAESIEALLDRLREHAWQGEIIGPHGAGKSTLLATLTDPLIAAGRSIVHVALHQGETSLPKALDDWRTWTAATQVIVDGYEQLSWWSRQRLAHRIRSRQSGLLVTSHATTGLPTLMTITPQFDAAEKVVRQLVPDETMLTSDDITQAFHASNGNIRETLFLLYDVYQARLTQNLPG